MPGGPVSLWTAFIAAVTNAAGVQFWTTLNLVSGNSGVGSVIGRTRLCMYNERTVSQSSHGRQ